MDKINIEIVMPEKGSRNIVRNSMRDLGFNNFTLGESIKDVKHAIHKKKTDLLILAAEFPDGDVNEVVRAMRHSEIGVNPFLTTLTIGEPKTDRDTRGIIDSGTDDFLVHPYSSAALRERIEVLAKSRKPFVVTSDYIGPDRRTKARREEGAQVPLLEVPNALRKLLDPNYSNDAFEKDIEAMQEIINLQRLDRYGFQILWLLEHTVPLLEEVMKESTVISPKIEDNMNRMVRIVNDTQRRIVQTAFESMEYLCTTLLSAIIKIQSNAGNVTEKDIRLLNEIANAFAKGLVADDENTLQIKKVATH